jgi:myo-inositol catabolism protein IolC
MNTGWTSPLYLLPFDHRASYVNDMFHFPWPLDATQHEAVVASKRLIYDGFCQAQESSASSTHAGILVDEQFGTDILRDAISRGYISAVSVEKSGSDEFECEYGEAFATHIHHFRPSFAKVLVRYNPEGDPSLNLRQSGRLKRVSDYCGANRQRFMFELLVPATEAQMRKLDGDKIAYDKELRPVLVSEAIHSLQEAGVEPDVWKIEGLETREDCEYVVAEVQRDGRKDVGCIVLGRGADENKVVHWLSIAASVPGFIGFAVGRTTFWDAVADFEAKKINRQEAVQRIAQRYRHWVDTFKQARIAHSGIKHSTTEIAGIA